MTVRQANVRSRVWRTHVALAVLCGVFCADSTVRSAIEAAQRAERWQDVHFSSGRLGAERANDPCDFHRRLRLLSSELLVASGRIAFALPRINSSILSCPAERREITITRLRFSRSSRKEPSLGGGGGDLLSAAVVGIRDLLRRKTITLDLLSLDYQEAGEDSASATFYLEGQDVASLLKSLSRISKVPVEVTAFDAAGLDRGVAVLVAPDRRLLANIPLWESQALALGARISRISPDGSTALANDALWDLPTGKLRRRLAQPPKAGRLPEVLSRDGRRLVWARNSGALNGKDAMRAGEVTIIDTTTAATVAHIGPLPWIDRILMVPDASLVLVLSHSQGIGFERTVSAVTLTGQVVWRGRIPNRSADIGRSDAARVLAFGRDWIRLWHGVTGESLLDSIAFPEQGPVAILDAASLEDRVIVVYAIEAVKHVASIDIGSGRVLNSARLTDASAVGFQTLWSPDRSVLLAASPDGRLSLWDTDKLRLIGDLNPQPGSSRLFAEFDASGELLATMRYSAEALDRHVIITDVRTRLPVGQCLLGDADAMQLASDGRKILGYQGKRVVFCRRAD